MANFEKYTDAATYAKIVDYKNVSQMWTHSVTTYANNVAIVDGEPITYAQLDAAVSRMRTALIAAGIKTGDRVGVYIPNSAAFAKTFLALTTMGAVPLLMPPHLDEMTVFGCSFKYELKALIHSPALAQNVGILKTKRPDFPVLTDDITAENATPCVDVDENAPCAILFTGGTTGKSKGALLSHRAVMRGAKNGCYGTKDVFEQKYFLVLPMTHVFGLVRNLITNFYTGSSLFVCKNNKDMFRDIATFRPNIIVLVPALAEMALNLSKQFGKNMLGPDIKTIICGASAVAPYLVFEYAKLGVTLLPGYGLTESANLVSGNPIPLEKPESVGYIYDGMEYKIVDGELWLKGVNMMDCYVGEPEENATAYEDGWFKTGDLVKMDDDGALYITGRKKEIIVLPSGENVSPAEVEVKFSALDIVQDCLLYDMTENGATFLVLEVLPRMAVLKGLGVEDVEGYVKEKVGEVNETLPSFQRVNKIIVRTTDFVRSPSMKIVRGQQNAKK